MVRNWVLIPCQNQTTGFSYSSLTLQVEWQEGHPAHKNPVIVPVSLSFVRAPAHPGVPGKRAVKRTLLLLLFLFVVSVVHLHMHSDTSCSTFHIFSTDFGLCYRSLYIVVLHHCKKIESETLQKSVMSLKPHAIFSNCPFLDILG